MDKADSIPENVMKVIRDLDIPFTEPLQPPLSHNIKNCALHAYHLLSLENRDLSFIRDVLCRVRGNLFLVPFGSSRFLISSAFNVYSNVLH